MLEEKMYTLKKQQSWTRRQALWLIAGGVSGIGLHACTQSTNNQTSSNPTASLGINTWIGYTPLYIAQEKGFFQQHGLNLNTQVFNAVAEAFPAFSTGRLDGIAPVTSEAVTLAARGIDYRIVWVYDTSNGADGILARNSVKSIQDFKGKQVAVQQGGVGHFFLLQVLEQAGLSGNDITIVNTDPEAAAAAYQAGSAEIACTYSPFMNRANVAQKDGRIIYDSSKIPTAIADFYVFSSKFIQENPKAVTAFVKGISQGLDFLKTNPQEGLAIASKRLNITPEELANQLKGIKLPDAQTNTQMLSNPQSDLYLLKPMSDLAQFLKDQKQIQNTPELAKVLDPQFVAAVKAQA